MINYLIPLLLFPYLVKVLGPEKFGLVTFAQVICQYFIVITDYSFNLTGTKKIALCRDNYLNRDTIFHTIMAAKLILLLICLGLFVTLIFLVSKLRGDFGVYVISFGYVIGTSIFPAWFFQGMEKMKYITFINFGVRFSFSLVMFWLINDVNDYIYVPILNSLGAIIGGCIALWFVYQSLGVKFCQVKLNVIYQELKSGWYIFISRVAISLYTLSNILFLGFFTNHVIVGYYSVAEKLVRALQTFIAPISQAVFPHVCKIANESELSAIEFVKKLTLILSIIMFIVSLVTFLFSAEIISLFFGKQYFDSILVIKIIAFIPFVSTFSNILGNQVMIPFGMFKSYAYCAVFIGLMNIFLLLFLISYSQHVGTAIAAIISETLLPILMYIVIRRKNLKHI